MPLTITEEMAKEDFLERRNLLSSLVIGKVMETKNYVINFKFSFSAISLKSES